MALLKGTDKDVAKLLRAAEKQGWTISITKGNHIKCVPPVKGQPILISSLTGHSSGNTKFRAAMIKAGVRP